MMKKSPLLLILLSLILFPQEYLANQSSDNPKQITFYNGTPFNPAIQAIVDSVSTDNIRTYIQQLAGFYTRHAASDTTSPDTGIGAARRWIKSKFVEFSNLTGSNLQPKFFWFTAPICGPVDLHANVMATLPGTLPQAQNRYFVVGGHMDSRTFGVCDSTSFAPGADDDGTGTAAALELARVMSAHQFDANLIYMTFTGEEQGLIGSTAYAEWAATNNLRIDGMINNDIIGNIIAPDGSVDSNTVRLFSESPATSPSRQLTRYFKLKGEQYVPEITINLIPAQDRPGRGGDHISFNDHGYAAIRFTEAVEREQHQHNPYDTLGAISPAYASKITKICAAGLASLALAPATPGAQLNIQDVGSGTELLLSWTPSNIEPDFAGYRIAWRRPDSLFYQGIIPVGNVTEYLLTGLPSDQPVYVSYSALDTDGNESIFSIEVLDTPETVPATPQGFDATSTANGVLLNWKKNQELDLAGYKLTRTGPPNTQQEFLLDSSAISFLDNTIQPHILYRYQIQARDFDGNLSAPSAQKRGRLPTHDSGIFVVDATKDGSGANPLQPTDIQVDNFYQNILQDFNISGQWDIADSMQQQLSISDADMAVHSTVIWHTDVWQGTHPIANDTLELRKYIDNGGKALLVGWGFISSAVGFPYNGPLSFHPGHFVHDYLQIDTSYSQGLPPDFEGATAVAPNFVSPAIDSAKIPSIYNHNLFYMEAFPSLVNDPQTEILYTYRSSAQPPSPLDGLPNALKHFSNNRKLLLLNFPLYFFIKADARQVIHQALIELGESPTSIPDQKTSGLPITKFDLQQNYPNPFNPVTYIDYRLPVQSKVQLNIYNLTGQMVKSLVDSNQPKGVHRVEWHGTDQNNLPVASGIYFYRLETDDFTKVMKLVLIR